MNDDTREILLILSEECAEVTQSISKCFRFGPDQIKPSKSKSNIEMLQEELGDLMCMVDLLVNKNIGVTYSGLNKAKAAKLEKLRCWSNIDIKKQYD